MTIDDVEKWAVAAGGAAIAFLVGIVRSGDIERIRSVEKAVADIHENHKDSENRVFDEIKDLRKDMERKHEHLVGLITKG